jgi:hypothetical protein
LAPCRITLAALKISPLLESSSRRYWTYPFITETSGGLKVLEENPQELFISLLISGEGEVLKAQNG